MADTRARAGGATGSNSQKAGRSTVATKKTTTKAAPHSGTSTTSGGTASERTAAGKGTRSGSAARRATTGTSRASSARSATGQARTATAVAERPRQPESPVPPGSDWTTAELAEVRREIEAHLDDLRAQYNQAIADLNALQRNGNDGAGDDQADAGTKTFEREQELSITNNRLDLLTQMERAIERMDAGTYGRCESCGDAIPKARLQAFPSATLCVRCKQREERR